MGATNQIKGTNISLQLEGLICPQCQQAFTKQEIDERNWECWFDTTNEVKLIEMKKIEEKFPDVKWEGEGRMKIRDFNKDYWDLLYYPFGRTGYQLTIWIRSIEHEDCPTVKECQKCYSKFLEDKMIETNDPQWGTVFYCQPCHQQINPTK